MSKPSAPTPPSPVSTDAAATGTNIGTAIANAYMNNMNQVTPTGTQSYNQTGTYNYTDPYTGQTYAIPQFTQTQTLSPAQQALQNTGQQTQQNLANLGEQQSSQLTSLLGTPMDLSGAPAAGNPLDHCQPAGTADFNRHVGRGEPSATSSRVTAVIST